MTTARVASRTHSAVALYTIAVLNLAMMDAAAKYLSRGYPTFEIVFFRSVFAFAPIFVYAAISGSTASLLRLPRGPRVWLHLIRGVSLFFTVVFFVLGLRRLPLADTTAISMSAPIFVLVFAAVGLRERATRSELAGVLLCFGAVFVVLQPSVASAGVGVVFPLLSAISYAAGVVTTRALAQVDTPLRTSFFTNCVVAALALACSFRGFVSPSATDLPYVVLIGVFGGVSNILFAAALNQDTSTRLAALDYTILLWAAFFGFALFGAVPGRSFYVGAALMTFGGLAGVFGGRSQPRVAGTTA